MNAEAPSRERPKQESSGLHTRAILLCAAGVVTIVLLVALVARVLTGLSGATDSVSRSPERAEPTRLSSRPEDEIAAFQREKRSQLESYGWIDRPSGLAHVPIERAMDMLAPSQNESAEEHR